eukprot:gene20125-23964_t
MQIVSSDRRSVSVKVFLFEKAATAVYCAAFVAPSVPQTTDDIVDRGVATSATVQAVVLSMTGLIPVTRYNIFCATVSLTGIAMPFAVARNNSISATTGCCKTIRVSVLAALGISGLESRSALQVELDFAPSSLMQLTWTMNNLSAIPLPASTSQSAFPVILPAFTEFNRTTWPLATSSFSIFSGGAAGQFRVSLNCSGRACAEFSFAYLTPRRFEV